ncbi:LexA family transcriptional regulator [Heyndrickxia sp. FSL W8-0496]|uniref:helix-turn-helix domain-containing protein n=1 Tax=Heyndrickxia sp. FSL W8-0496 TaxID=2954702 RepID=UPI0030FAA86A
MVEKLNEESFGDFFRRLRRSKGFKSQKSLAELSGVSQTTISRIEDGSQNPTPETLKLLAKVLKVSNFDLMALAGHYDEEDLLDPLHVIKDEMIPEDKLDSNNVQKPNNIEYKKIEDQQRIPVLGYVAAGIPIERSEHIEGYELVEQEIIRGREVFGLRVKGESMIGDGIYDGDTVIVVKQVDIAPSDIAVVAVNGHEATLKRVKCENGMCMLIPSNPNMQPILVPAKDVYVIGKVIQSRRSFE